jgi:F0F1-type ATP synthase assembly protein I
MTPPGDAPTALEKMLDARNKRLARGKQYRSLMYWSGRAMEAPLAVVVGLVMGVCVDRYFPTAPYGMWVGLFFGIATAVRFAYRLVQSYKREFPDD